MTEPLPQSSSTPQGWESLAPWEKAAEWSAAVPEIADRVMDLATKQAEHRRSMERQRSEHVARLELAHSDYMQKMATRLWLTQIFGLAGGMISVIIFGVVSWHYADTGAFGPSLATLGAGTGFSAAVYGVGKSVARRQSSVAGPAGAGLDSSQE